MYIVVSEFRAEVGTDKMIKFVLEMSECEIIAVSSGDKTGICICTDMSNQLSFYALFYQFCNPILDLNQ